MAYYGFEINSQFKPFDYDTLSKMVAGSNEAHKNAQAAIDEKVKGSESIKHYVDNEALTNPDAEWVKKYNDYRASLEEASNNLATVGLQPNTASTITDLSRRYMADVAPIASAISQQANLAKARIGADPKERMVYSKLPSIDELLDNMNIVPKAYSGAKVNEEARNAAKAISDRNVFVDIKKDPRFANYIRKIKETGYDIQLMKELDMFPGLNDIRNNIKLAHGNFEGLSEEDKQRMDDEISKGIYEGISYDIDVNTSPLHIQTPSVGSPKKTPYTINPHAIKNIDFLKVLNPNLARKNKYFTIEGGIRITEEGFNKLKSMTDENSNNDKDEELKLLKALTRGFEREKLKGIEFSDFNIDNLDNLSPSDKEKVKATHQNIHREKYAVLEELENIMEARYKQENLSPFFDAEIWQDQEISLHPDAGTNLLHSIADADIYAVKYNSETGNVDVDEQKYYKQNNTNTDGGNGNTLKKPKQITSVIRHRNTGGDNIFIAKAIDEEGNYFYFKIGSTLNSPFKSSNEYFKQADKVLKIFKTEPDENGNYDLPEDMKAILKHVHGDGYLVPESISEDKLSYIYGVMINEAVNKIMDACTANTAKNYNSQYSEQIHLNSQQE